ncbi:uncharacterized protein N7473_013111 [Penicillium subrubescens]|uniref:uncharacterized protein n=1 Tax=Penicillium subrubescens TaxID=1316194 RepID=UPI0025455D80|nr:uncharacterized protein N7473_013111 [Penicillium subrubescens]KAJ5874998.1 hypothetical protein N7473_013111 [Penicillium subrubescens]
MSVKVCEAVEAAIKKTSNAGPSAPPVPRQCWQHPQEYFDERLRQRQPEERAPAPERILPAARDQYTY